MTITILSIFIFTFLVWALNKILPIKICPICAGVMLTWLWMLWGIWFDFLSVARYEFVVAILMGMSIGGTVTELKKLFSKLRGDNGAKDKKIELLENKLKNCC